MKPVIPFEELFEKIKPHIPALEERRKSIRKKATKHIMIWGSIFLVIGIALSTEISPLYCLGWGVAILFVIMYFILRSDSQRLSEFYKKEIITVLVQNLVEKGKYYPEKVLRKKNTITAVCLKKQTVIAARILSAVK